MAKKEQRRTKRQLVTLSAIDNARLCSVEKAVAEDDSRLSQVEATLERAADTFKDLYETKANKSAPVEVVKPTTTVTIEIVGELVSVKVVKS